MRLFMVRLPVMALMLATFLQTASAEMLYYFNHHSSITNFKQLKTEFDGYLAQQGGYQFQPFDNADKLYEHIVRSPSSLMLVPQSEFMKLRARIPMHLLLVAHTHGRTTTRQIAVTRVGNKALKGRIVASAYNPDIARRIAKALLGEAFDETMQFLQVPKDLDALMSVSFKVADIALSSFEAYEQIKKINPLLAEELHVAKTGQRILRLIYAASYDVPNTLITRMLETMHSDAEGQIRLEMLGVDYFSKPTPGDLEYLKEEQ